MQKSNIKDKLKVQSKKILYIIAISLIITLYQFNVVTLIHPQEVFAQASYPIAELGNCDSQSSCANYCEIPQNTPACWSYGKYLMNADQDVLGDATSALTPTPTITFNITYPVADLGNCKDAANCFSYCSYPEHAMACYNFAMSHKIAKAKEIKTVKIIKSLEAAKLELGCSTKDECRIFCSLSANFDKCRTFAAKEGLEEQTTASSSARISTPEIIDAARAELGCNARLDCATFCAKAENREKCIAFSQKYNIGPPPKPYITPAIGTSNNQSTQTGTLNPAAVKMLTGDTKYPAACTTSEACIKYCNSHAAECKGFDPAKIPPILKDKPNIKITLTPNQEKELKAKALKTIQSGEFLGPGGCKTESECKAYCEKHTGECPGFPTNLYLLLTPMPKPLSGATTNTEHNEVIRPTVYQTHQAVTPTRTAEPAL